MGNKATTSNRQITTNSYRLIWIISGVIFLWSGIILFLGEPGKYLYIPGDGSVEVVVDRDTCLNEYFQLRASTVTGSTSITVQSDDLDSASLINSHLLLIESLLPPEGMEKSGNYEFARVDSVSGATLYLSHELQNSYEKTKTQIVVSPRIDYLRVRKGSSLTCQPFENGTGGIVFLMVGGDIILEKDAVIETNGKGGWTSTSEGMERRSGDHHRHLYLGATNENESATERDGGMILLFANSVSGKGTIQSNGSSATHETPSAIAGNGGLILLQLGTALSPNVEAKGGNSSFPTGIPGKGGFVAGGSSEYLNEVNVSDGEKNPDDGLPPVLQVSGKVFQTWVPPIPTLRTYHPVNWVNLTSFKEGKTRTIQWVIEKVYPGTTFQIQKSVEGGPFLGIREMIPEPEDSLWAFMEVTLLEAEPEENEELYYRIVQKNEGNTGNPSPVIRPGETISSSPKITCQSETHSIRVDWDSGLDGGDSTAKAYLFHESDLKSMSFTELDLSSGSQTFHDAAPGNYILYLTCTGNEITRQISLPE